jgi:hypothetical protein
MSDIIDLPVTLIDVLANSVILRQLAPYIPIRSLLNLSATNKAIREFMFSQPEPWCHLDLTGVKSAIIESSPIDIGGFSWRAERSKFTNGQKATSSHMVATWSFILIELTFLLYPSLSKTFANPFAHYF